MTAVEQKVPNVSIAGEIIVKDVDGPRVHICFLHLSIGRSELLIFKEQCR